MAAMPEPTQLGFNVGHIVNPGHGVPKADNAIHPTWRNASSFVITNVLMTGQESWSAKKERERFNTNVVGKALRDASPNGASYVNEVSLCGLTSLELRADGRTGRSLRAKLATSILGIQLPTSSQDPSKVRSQRCILYADDTWYRELGGN